MQQIKVQLKDAKLDQRIHECVPSRVPGYEHGGGRGGGYNILLCDVGMSGDGGSLCSTRRFDGIRIVMIARGDSGV